MIFLDLGVNMSFLYGVNDLFTMYLIIRGLKYHLGLFDKVW